MTALCDAREVTDDYLRECARPVSALRTCTAEFDLTAELAAGVGNRILSRPLFVDRREIEDFALDVRTVFETLVSLPRRLFGDDLFAFCAAIKVPAAQVPPLLRGYGRDPVPFYGRADMYHDGTRFRLLELNIDSEIGGLDKAGEIPRLFFQQPAFRDFAARHPLTFDEPAGHLAATLRGLAGPDRPEPVVALLQLEEPSPRDQDYDSRRSLTAVLRRMGIDFRVDTAAAVTESAGELRHRGDRVDVVVRGFSAHEIVTEPDGWARVEPVLRAADRGGVILWTPLHGQLFMNKANLALLSDPRYRAAFSPEEQAAIERVVPWTRALDLHTSPGERAALAAEQEELIIKPNLLYGGRGVVAGWERSEQEWQAALEGAARFGAIVQRRVRPRAEPVVTPGATREAWTAAWGLFVTPAGYAGAYARLLAEGEGAVIGVNADRRTQVAGVFTV